MSTPLLVEELWCIGEGSLGNQQPREQQGTANGLSEGDRPPASGLKRCSLQHLAGGSQCHTSGSVLRACFSFPAPSGGLPTLTALDSHLSLIFLVHWSKTLYLTFLHILSLVNTPGMINSCCLCCKSIISSCPHQKTPGSFSMQDMLRHTGACVCMRACTHTHTQFSIPSICVCVCSSVMSDSLQLYEP